jgi:hypothetical protein
MCVATIPRSCSCVSLLLDSLQPARVTAGTTYFLLLTKLVRPVLNNENKYNATLYHRQLSAAALCIPATRMAFLALLNAQSAK